MMGINSEGFMSCGYVIVNLTVYLYKNWKKAHLRVPIDCGDDDFAQRVTLDFVRTLLEC